MTLRKKFITLLMTIVALMPIIGFAANEIQVPGVWGFTPASTQGSYIRALFEQANIDQNKYQFIFENRPGAGGALATNYVLSHSKTLMVLAHSPALFIRPYLYPETTTYTFNQIKPVMVMAISPTALLTKGRPLEQLVSQDTINIGTAGTGSSTHLMAEAFAGEIHKRYPNKIIQMVHFPSTNEAYLSVMGGHIDACFEYMGDAVAKATKDVTVIGITGKTKIKDYVLLKDAGYPEMEYMVLPFALFVAADTPSDVIAELATILLRAERVDSVQRLYKSDFGTKDDYMKIQGDLMPWYNAMVKKFEKLTKGISVK